MEKLAILDCGGQYTKVIDRKVRELGVKSEILPMPVLGLNRGIFSSSKRLLCFLG